MASRKAKKAAIMAKNSAKRMAKRLRTEGLLKGAMGGGAVPLIPESFAAGNVVEEATSSMGRLGKAKKLLGKPMSGIGAAGGIGAMLASMLAAAVINERGAGIQSSLQGREMDIQGQYAAPENYLINALLPSSEQQKQQAMQALMQQLTGGNAPRQLARGEVLT